MKFCSKCGTQLADEAVICIGCGRMVINEEKVEPPKNTKEKDAIKKTSGIITVFEFIHAILVVISTFFAGMSMIFANIESNIYSTAYSKYVKSYLYPEDDFAIFAFLVALISFACGVTNLIFILVGKHRGKMVYSAIVRLTISLALSFCSILMLLAS